MKTSKNAILTKDAFKTEVDGWIPLDGRIRRHDPTQKQVSLGNELLWMGSAAKLTYQCSGRPATPVFCKIKFLISPVEFSWF